jgi:parallel beta-helix repeat protein
VLDNDISVPDPDRLLSPQGPLFAIGIGPAQECVVEGNRIEGHPSGIVLFGEPGRTTRRNVIRDNTITVRGAGFALGLWGGQEDVDGTGIEDNLVERNRIMGGVGVGIALNRASRNRILDNTITGITSGDPSVFGEANGAGLWVSPGSDENEIGGNTFEDIATHPIVLEGDGNAVQTRGASEAVHDLGNDNRVTRRDPGQTH